MFFLLDSWMEHLVLKKGRVQMKLMHKSTLRYIAVYLCSSSFMSVLTALCGESRQANVTGVELKKK